MRPAVIIALKDLRQRLRDRSAILLGVVAPLGLALIFSQIIPDFSGDEFVVNMGVVDEDGGTVAVAFIDDVLGSIVDDGLAELTTYDSEEAAAADVDGGTLDAAYIIPMGFTEAVTTGAGAEMIVVGNVDAQISTAVAASIAESFASNLVGIQIAVVDGLAAGAGDPASLSQAAVATPNPVSLVDSTQPSKVLDPITFFGAGMAIFFLFFTVQFGVTSLIEERVDGTMPRLLAAPIPKMSIIAGKGIASFLIGVIATAVLVVATSLFIGADWGAPLGVALLVVAGVLSAIGIMALIATFARSGEQAANWQAIVAVVLGLMGGTFFPISQGPSLLSQISLLTPHAWFMRGMGNLATGEGAAVVIGPVLAILVFAAVTMAIASLRVRKMVAP